MPLNAKLEDAVTGQRSEIDNGTMATVHVKLVSASTGECSDYVLVPRAPTEAMIKAGWFEAHEENASGVWRDMIEAWESSVKNGKFDSGQRLNSSFPEF
jgi:hypothetical protein